MMSRLMVMLVLGLVTSAVVARNVESEKEKIDDVKEEDAEKEGKTRNKRETNDLLERNWQEYINERKMEQAIKELKREAIESFLAERKKKLEKGHQTYETICTCHTFQKNGVREKKCFPDGCDDEQEHPDPKNEGYAA